MSKAIRSLALAGVVLGAATLAWAQQAINAKCPIKGQAVNPSITATYKGKTIGFCWNGCKATFTKDPDAVAAKIPELKAPEPKPGPAKPENTTPCEVKKTTKGYYCLDCKRELTLDDVRNNVCKRCEKKPAEIEYCVARIVSFVSKCQHAKKMDKPFVCCGKTWATPSFTEDLARVSYECESCGVKGDIEPEIKHKEGCKPKFGGGLKKVCAKSGKAPHVGDDK